MATIDKPNITRITIADNHPYRLRVELSKDRDGYVILEKKCYDNYVTLETEYHNTETMKQFLKDCGDKNGSI